MSKYDWIDILSMIKWRVCRDGKARAKVFNSRSSEGGWTWSISQIHLGQAHYLQRVD